MESERLNLIRAVLSEDRVLFLSEEGKDEALRALAGVLAAGCGIRDQAELESEIAEREKLMSTGIGMGLAVPHVRLASVRQLTMAVGISRKGISDYASLDDKPVHLVFMIAAPAGQHSDYLRLLSVVSARAKALNGRLLEPANSRDFCRLLTEVEVLDAGEGAKS